MHNIRDFLDRINEADLILVGIGEEFKSNIDEARLLEVYNNLAQILGNKNYYVVSLCEDYIINKSNVKSERVVLPLRDDTDEGEKAWNNYLLWLSCTLNKKLLILELGVLLGAPQVIRWPFEKTTMLNNKAYMIRVNESLPNITPDIAGKAQSIAMNAFDFMMFEE